MSDKKGLPHPKLDMPKFGKFNTPRPIRDTGSVSAGVAPRTFEVIQRGLLRKERDELLDSYDTAAVAARRQAAELARQSLEGTPSGSGVRTAQSRRMAQELAPQFQQIETSKAEKAYDTRGDIMAAGDTTSDRMVKLTTYQQLIQKAWDDGKGEERIAQMIKQWIDIEPDLWMKQELAGLGEGLPGFATLGTPKKEPGILARGVSALTLGQISPEEIEGA